ncbi:MAG: hypothetical protein DKT66_09530 [Candidatus Melainabacteria bacterium]|nr:MAG: hypothetical protein DKT66_09530 [Candidatus Melainabacteria bacterium]
MITKHEREALPQWLIFALAKSGLSLQLTVIVSNTKKDSRMGLGKKRASTRSNAIALSSKGVTA